MTGVFGEDASAGLEIRLTPSHRALAARVRTFVDAELAAHEDDESDVFARAITQKMGDAGLLAPATAIDVRAICLARETIASRSGLADSMFALQGLGYAPIELADSELHRKMYRERVERGEAIAAFAVTEAEAGSDVAAMRTTAVAHDAGYKLSGTKAFITNTGLADFYLVVARTSDDGARGLSAFCVPADKVRVVERYDLIAPHPCGVIAFDDVELDRSALVGTLGSGFRLAMETLDRFRSTVGAAAVGMATRALEEARSRAQKRKQFGKPIARFQQVGAMLADSYAELLAARLSVYRAATAMDEGLPDASLLASCAKMTATEVAQRVADRAVQIHGGEGVRRGSVVERIFRDVRALRIYEGTTEIQRVVISRKLTA